MWFGVKRKIHFVHVRNPDMEKSKNIHINDKSWYVEFCGKPISVYEIYCVHGLNRCEYNRVCRFEISISFDNSDVSIVLTQHEDYEILSVNGELLNELNVSN